MAIYQTTLQREDTNGESKEITVFVEYTYYKAYRGARDSFGGKHGAGLPLEPDEPAHIEIDGVKDENGNAIELTRLEEERISGDCFDYVVDCARDYPERN